MRRAAWLPFALLVAPVASFAESPAYPPTLLLQDTRTTTALLVKCEPPSGFAMLCNFTETRIEPGNEAAAQALPARSECGALESIAGALLEGTAPPGGDAEVSRERRARRTPAEVADLEAVFAAFRAYCASEAGSEDRLKKLLAERASRTCTITIASYALEFIWDSGAGQWESRSGTADDGCRTFTVAAFEQVPESSGNTGWKYRISTGSGREAEASCPAKPDTLHLYAADAIDLRLGCDFLRFQN